MTGLTLPDALQDVGKPRPAGGFRFANELRRRIDVDGETIVAYSQSGGLRLGAMTLALGRRPAVIAAVALPDARPEPNVATTSARSTQTAGGASECRHYGVPTAGRSAKSPRYSPGQ